jgi:leader peptidase (prepilin peptidase)/N-methyltransferase
MRFQRNISGAVIRVYLLLASFPYLAAIAYIDIKTLRIPDRLLVPLFCVMLIVRGLEDPAGIFYLGLSGALTFLVYYAVYRLSAYGLGFGDVKFAGVLGFGLGGYGSWLTSFGACVAGIIFYICFLRKEGGDRLRFPFGPFLSFGAVIAMCVEIAF